MKNKILALILCVSLLLPAFAVGAGAYDTELDNRAYATKVETQTEDDCLYYAILSTAGSYAKKYYGASDSEADFSESRLRNTVDSSENYGEVLYGSVGCYIGNNYCITSAEILTGRGERYIKEKIKENGAVFAAISLPSGGMADEEYYNPEKANFSCPEENLDSSVNHAISIVGWNDDYDRLDFNHCHTKGAWLCKNSYGTDYGDGGYFWLPYEYPLLYAASLEVSHFRGINLIMKSADISSYTPGFIYAVNIRAYENITENVEITVGGKTVYSEETTLKNGCNYIAFDKAVRAGSVSVNGEEISASADSIYCYLSLFGRNRMSVASPEADENWLVYADSISINLDVCTAFTLVEKVYHNMYKSAVDNNYYITPADGYYIDGNTKINYIKGSDDDSLFVEDYYAKFDNDEPTISKAVAADYKCLTDGSTGEWLKMIEFTDGADGRGKLVIKSQGNGGAKVENINILTDETGAVSSLILTFDNGSVYSPDDVTVSMFSDSGYTEEITSCSGMNEYYARIALGYGTSDGCTVSLNGIETGTVVSGGTAEVRITVPDVTQTPIETLMTFILFFSKILAAFK